jgi:two-component system response regulator HydG
MQYSELNRKQLKGFTPPAMDMLVKYGWPGNVRELENAVERAVILSAGEFVAEKDLPPIIFKHFSEFYGKIEPLVSGSVAGKSLQEVEKIAIEETLAQTGGNKSEAAKLLNITRTTLDNKIRKYDIEIIR